MRENYKGTGVTRIDTPILSLDAAPEDNPFCITTKGGYEKGGWYFKDGRKIPFFRGKSMNHPQIVTADGEASWTRPNCTLETQYDNADIFTRISGIKGFSEYRDGHLTRTGVYVQLKSLYYVFDKKEADVINTALILNAEDMTDFSRKLSEYKDKKMHTAYSYRAMVFDLENKRLYIRRSHENKLIDFKQKGPSFRTLGYEAGISEEIIRSMLFDNLRTHSDVWPELKANEAVLGKAPARDSDAYWDYACREVSYETEYAEHLVRKYIIDSIEDGSQEFRAYASIVKEKAKSGIDRKCLGESAFHTSEDELIKWHAAVLFVTESGIPMFGSSLEDLRIAMYCLKGVRDKKASGFHAKYGENVFEKLAVLYPDYPKGKAGRRFFSENPYRAITAWSTLKRLKKTDNDSFIALYGKLSEIAAQTLEDYRDNFGEGLCSHDQSFRWLGALGNSSLQRNVIREARDYFSTRSIPKLLKSRNFAEDVEYYTAVDAFFMYQKLKKTAGIENCIARNGKAFSRLDIRELHDEASLLGTKYERENMPLRYPEKQTRRFNIDVGHYSFRLAKETYDIVRVGQKLENCLATAHYDSIISGEEHLCYAVDNDTNKIEAAISITRNWRNLIEIKGYKNLFLEGDVAKASKKWLDRTELSYTGNDDVRNFGKHTTAFGAPRDFHTMEIMTDENGKEYIADKNAVKRIGLNQMDNTDYELPDAV